MYSLEERIGGGAKRGLQSDGSIRTMESRDHYGQKNSPQKTTRRGGKKFVGAEIKRVIRGRKRDVDLNYEGRSINKIGGAERRIERKNNKLSSSKERSELSAKHFADEPY